MRPTRHVQALKGYVHKNLKKNKIPRSHHQVPLQVSPTKAAKYALELAVASLPTSLQPLILHFGNQIITARCKRYAKKSIMQRMEDDAKYIPRPAKATDFEITLSAGANEDEERVSFLEQQIQQAKDSLRVLSQDCD